MSCPARDHRFIIRPVADVHLRMGSPSKAMIYVRDINCASRYLILAFEV